MPARLKADAIDRDRIRTSLETCIDLLSTVEHPEHIVNVVSGRISPDSVNVENSVTIGKEQMKKYEATWPGGFNDALPIKVISISVTKKEIKIGSSSTFDTELIYSRVMGEVFQYELAPDPTSMFDYNGNMRLSGAKSVLIAKLQVDQSARTLLPPTIIIIDGCAILWIIHWPTNGTVQDFVNGFIGYVFRKLCESV